MGKQQKEKPGTMIYFDIASSVKMLSDEEAGKLFKGILEYSQYGVVPDFDGQYSMLGMAWGGVVKPALDRANEHYIDAVYKQKIKGLMSTLRIGGTALCRGANIHTSMWTASTCGATGVESTKMLRFWWKSR